MSEHNQNPTRVNHIPIEVTQQRLDHYVEGEDWIPEQIIDERWSPELPESYEIDFFNDHRSINQMDGDFYSRADSRGMLENHLDPLGIHDDDDDDPIIAYWAMYQDGHGTTRKRQQQRRDIEDELINLIY
jgi:hypothetical protein